MHSTPIKLRKELSEDPWYRRCARGGEENCYGQITWEHAILYAGKQLNEKFAIIPLCWFHHLGPGLDKGWNVKTALMRASADDKRKYPRLKWDLLVEN